MVKLINLQRTSEASCDSSFKGQLLAEVEIQVKEGGTALNKTSSKYTVEPPLTDILYSIHLTIRDKMLWSRLNLHYV